MTDRIRLKSQRALATHPRTSALALAERALELLEDGHNAFSGNPMWQGNESRTRRFVAARERAYGAWVLLTECRGNNPAENPDLRAQCVTWVSRIHGELDKRPNAPLQPPFDLALSLLRQYTAALRG